MRGHAQDRLELALDVVRHHGSIQASRRSSALLVSVGGAAIYFWSALCCTAVP
jgi:hypothetical protein